MIAMCEVFDIAIVAVAAFYFVMQLPAYIVGIAWLWAYVKSTEQH